MTDPKLLCQNYFKGKCKKGRACIYHHNGPCSFHKNGMCNKGDKCVFTHHEPVLAPVALIVNPGDAGPNPKATAESKAKATGKAKA